MFICTVCKNEFPLKCTCLDKEKRSESLSGKLGFMRYNSHTIMPMTKSNKHIEPTVKTHGGSC